MIEVGFAALREGFSFDLRSGFQDARCPTEVDIGRREVVECLVIAAMIVMLDEVADGAFQVAGQVVVRKRCPVPTFRSPV